MNRIKQFILERQLKKDLDRKREAKRKASKPRVRVGLIKSKHKNLIDSTLVPYKYMQVEKGKYYTIKMGKFEDELFFKCIKSGRVLVKYRYSNELKKDIILLKGTGQLCCEIPLTEGS